MAFDKIVPCTLLLEGIARQRRTKMHGSYIDFGCISDPFGVRFPSKPEENQYPVRLLAQAWLNHGFHMNLALVSGPISTEISV